MMFCHYAVCIGPFVPLSLFLCWFPGAAEVGVALACQTAGYFIVWLTLDLKYRKEIRELNRIRENDRNESESKENDK